MAAVLDLAESHSELAGQPTSVSMLLAQGNQAAISHTGDSRVYLIRRGADPDDDRELIHQLTSDHDLTDSQPEDLPERSDESPIDPSRIKIDTFLLTLQPGDTYVLCTDGAEEVVEDPHVLGPVSETSPRMLAYRIVTAAHKHNPDVDATVVVVRVRDDFEPNRLWLSKVPKKFKLGHALAWT
jgi:serine/threonine protein phosphatase PrpC